MKLFGFCRGGNNLGRIYFWLHRDGIVDPDELNEAEWAELLMYVTPYKQALRDLFKPDLFNFAYLANEETHGHHCHWHLVPRYKMSRAFDGTWFDDQAWGKQWQSGRLDPEVAIKLGAELKKRAAPMAVHLQ